MLLINREYNLGLYRLNNVKEKFMIKTMFQKKLNLNFLHYTILNLNKILN